LANLGYISDIIIIIIIIIITSSVFDCNFSQKPMKYNKRTLVILVYLFRLKQSFSSIYICYSELVEL